MDFFRLSKEKIFNEITKCSPEEWEHMKIFKERLDAISQLERHLQTFIHEGQLQDYPDTLTSDGA
jgi:hypothetical protein